MVVRCRVQGLVLLCLATVLVGCAANGLNSVQITPTVQSLTVGQTAQFSAVGTYGNASHLSTQNITGTVTWTSSAPSVATVSASGMATAVSAGTTTITASAQGWSGHVSDTAVLTVAVSGGGGTYRGEWRKHPFAHHHSQRNCLWQLAGQWAVPGDWNILEPANRERCDQLGHLVYLRTE